MLDATMPRTPQGDSAKLPASTRLPADVHKGLSKIAEEERRTLSQIIEFAAVEYWERRQKKAKERGG
jgi:predicted transcriptional regulator